MVEPEERTRAGVVLDGRYELLRELGTGGASTVWLARDPSGAEVAVKLMHPHLRLMETSRRRFAQEAMLLAELDHPSIVRALHFDLDGARPYIAMQYREGMRLDQELRARLEDAAHFPGSMLERIVRQLVGAIAHAHDQGIVHRDLKPINIILSADGDVSVLDFGVARLLDDSDETTLGRVIGTYRYMSPEQVLGQRVDPRSDIFTLGLLLFELLTLKPAWPRGVPASDLRQRICEGPRPKPTAVRAELDPGFDALIARATAIDPNDRPASALQLLAELEPLLETLAPMDERTRVLEPIAVPKARSRLIGPLLLGLTIAALGAVAIAIHREPEARIEIPPAPHEEPPPPIEVMPREVPKDPPLEAPRAKVEPIVRRPNASRPPSPPPPIDPLKRVRDRVALAEAAPTDMAKHKSASQAIAEAIDASDPAQQKRLRRMLEVAEVSNDPTALRRILDELERARRPR